MFLCPLSICAVTVSKKKGLPASTKICPTYDFQMTLRRALQELNTTHTLQLRPQILRVWKSDPPFCIWLRRGSSSSLLSVCAVSLGVADFARSFILTSLNVNHKMIPYRICPTGLPRVWNDSNTTNQL